jgi:hypothetical protein
VTLEPPEPTIARVVFAMCAPSAGNGSAKHEPKGSFMPDQVDLTVLHHAVEQLAQAVQGIATQAGDVPAVRRLRNDVERVQIDMGDCTGLQQVTPPVRKLEVIPDTPYDESLWQGVDDEGLGGFHPSTTPQSRHRTRR